VNQLSKKGCLLFNTYIRKPIRIDVSLSQLHYKNHTATLIVNPYDCGELKKYQAKELGKNKES
jgi:hypothetical protein